MFKKIHHIDITSGLAENARGLKGGLHWLTG